MDAYELTDRIQHVTHPHGHVLIHIIGHDREYWLDVENVTKAYPQEIGWTDGVIIHAKPIPDGPRAARDIRKPRPFFHQSSEQTEPALAPGLRTLHQHTEHTVIQSPMQQIVQQVEIQAQIEPQGQEPTPIHDDLVRKQHEEQRRQQYFEAVACKSPEQINQMAENGDLAALAARYGIIEEPEPKQERISLRPHASGEITGPLYPGALERLLNPDERIQDIVDKHFGGKDPYESVILNPRPAEPIVGRKLHDADPSVPDLSRNHTKNLQSPIEDHYAHALDLNRREITNIFGVDPQMGEIEPHPDASADVKDINTQEEDHS